jgi:hypothetical protein
MFSFHEHGENAADRLPPIVAPSHTLPLGQFPVFWFEVTE